MAAKSLMVLRQGGRRRGVTIWLGVRRRVERQFHGPDLMDRIRRRPEAAELDKPSVIDPVHLDGLDVDAALAWVWRGP